MLRHGLYLGVELFLDLDDVFLVVFGDKVDGQTDLSIPATTAYSVQIGAALVREVEVDHHIHCRYIDASSDQVRPDQSLELTLSEALEHLRPFLCLHSRVQVPVFVRLLV